MSAPRPDYVSERNWDIFALRRAGVTLAAIASRYGITRTRVNQIAVVTEFRITHPPLRARPHQTHRPLPSAFERAAEWKRETRREVQS